MTAQFSTNDVIAFRLHAHHLTERVSRGGLLDASGRCGVQNSPPGSALLALHARVHELTRERVDEAVAEDRSLLQSWCMRGAPFHFPTEDAPVFTTGVLPPTEGALRQFVLGAGPAVDKLGLDLTEAVELAGAEIVDVLTGRRLAIDALGARIAERIGRKLSKGRRDIWEQEGPHAAGQPLGEAVVHFCVRVLALQQVVCFAPRAGNKAPFVLAHEWLRGPVPRTEPEAARAELLRRYLRCYGPSTRADFAAWLGLRAGDVAPWWSQVEDEMVQVGFGRRTTWVLADDLDALRSPPTPKGARLLPPRDPYIQLRDRDTIVDKKYHRDVWKAVGAPGTVLTDGRITGSWRPRTSGRKLTVSITSFGPLSARHRKSLETEAEQLAPLRGASSVHIEFDTL